MNIWEAKVRHRLNIPEKEELTFERGCSAWTFTGKYQAYDQPNAKCELCGNAGLRHHFLIANIETGEALWIGSQCILKFNEGIYGEVKKVQRARQKEEKQIIEESLVETIMEPLAKLYEVLPRKRQRNLHWVVGKFRRRGGFSPAELVSLFRALSIEGIPYEVAISPVLIRSQQDKVEFIALKREELETIWESLTEKQRLSTKK